jgi:hypothetical protein
VKERVFDYEEFCRRLNKSWPVHYAATYRKAVDKHGILFKVWLSLTGIADKGHLIEFYIERDFMVADEEKAKEWLKELDEKFIKPINATPGEWMD